MRTMCEEDRNPNSLLSNGKCSVDSKKEEVYGKKKKKKKEQKYNKITSEM